MRLSETFPILLLYDSQMRSIKIDVTVAAVMYPADGGLIRAEIGRRTPHMQAFTAEDCPTRVQKALDRSGVDMACSLLLDSTQGWLASLSTFPVHITFVCNSVCTSRIPLISTISNGCGHVYGDRLHDYG